MLPCRGPELESVSGCAVPVLANLNLVAWDERSAIFVVPCNCVCCAGASRLDTRIRLRLLTAMLPLHPRLFSTLTKCPASGSEHDGQWLRGETKESCKAFQLVPILLEPPFNRPLIVLCVACSHASPVMPQARLPSVLAFRSNVSVLLETWRLARARFVATKRPRLARSPSGLLLVFLFENFPWQCRKQRSVSEAPRPAHTVLPLNIT